MPSAAGQRLVAGRIPGERIATMPPAVVDTAGFTAETETATVTAQLVSGRTYRVTYQGIVRTTVANDRAGLNIREDSLVGVVLETSDWTIPHAGSVGVVQRLEATFTAAATGPKTFKAGVLRVAGTGTLTARGSTASKRYFYVDYIEG